MIRAINQNATPNVVTRCATLAKWTLGLGLAASMLFAHGCHGDEDHELFTRISAWVAGDSSTMRIEAE